MERRRWIGPGDHLTDDLVIDVRLADGDWAPTAEDLVVVVEPCYGNVAVAAALDAGWRSVEIAAADADTAPIPLISFEQPVPVEVDPEARCRVRCTDLEVTLDRVTADGATPVLAAPANARPSMSTLARACESCTTVTFVPAARLATAAEADDRHDPLTVDGMWAAGMLIRVLLDELDIERGVRLADAAGVAVMVAQGAEDAATQLAAGARWRDHLDAGGAPADLQVAAAVDSIGSVPLITFDDVEGVHVATAWHLPA